MPSMRQALKKRQENLAHIEESIHLYMRTLLKKMLAKTKTHETTSDQIKENKQQKSPRIK